MNWVLIRSRYMGIIKAKSSKNRRKSKSHAKTEETRSTTRRTAVPRAHDRASLHHGPCAPHGQPVVATGPPGPDASSFLWFDLFWTSVWALDLHVLGLLCSFA